MLQGIPSAASLATVWFDFAKEGSRALTLPTVSLFSKSRADPTLLPMQVPHAAASRAACRGSVPASAQVGADPASPDLPGAALLQGREPLTLGAAGCSREVFSCLCGGFLEELEERRLWPLRDSDETQPSIEEWALGETHSGSRDYESEGRGAFISDGSQQESGVVVLFVSHSSKCDMQQLFCKVSSPLSPHLVWFSSLSVWLCLFFPLRD